MTPLQLELTKLIGKKELSFGCYLNVKMWKSWIETMFFKTVIVDSDFSWNQRRYKTRHPLYEVYEEYVPFAIEKQELEIIGHPATLSDLHRWMNSKNIRFCQEGKNILYSWGKNFQYDSSKDLLDQKEETLKQIIDFIKNN